MDVKIITTTEEFDALRDDWNAVYSADPHATIFMSWAWLRGWIEGESRRWAVVGLRPDTAEPFVAFMILCISRVPSWVAYRLPVLHMGGHPLSDHTGFVCLPKYTEKSLDVFAMVIRKRLGIWSKFCIGDVMDPRLDMFLEKFHPDAYIINHSPETPAPYLTLPGTWEEYLEQNFGSVGRRGLLRRLRRLEAFPNFRVTIVDKDNLESQIESCLRLHELRFGKQDEERIRRFRMLFRSCFESDSLWLTVMWLGDSTIAALAAFLDRQKGTFGTYVTGFDPEFADLAPGRVMFTYSIRYAIREGYREVDFLRGAESYKYMLAAKDRFNTNVVIKPRGVMRVIEGCDQVIRRGVSKLRRVMEVGA